MLALLNISNIALIDELRVEFDSGLNLLTGETGSGKSIIVDALGVLIGARFSSDLLKSGSERAFIEGLFSVVRNPRLEAVLASAGINLEDSEAVESRELIIRRELSTTGRNKIFINNQLATQSLLRDLRPFLVDIHGQGDQQSLFDTDTHLELLDSFAGGVGPLRAAVAESYECWSQLRRQLDELHRNEAEKFQLVDTLRFQIGELERAELAIGEDERLEEERRLLINAERLTALSSECYRLVYDDDDAALSRVLQTTKRLEELSEYEVRFQEYHEGLLAARAVLEDLAFSLRDFSEKLEFSPSRLAEIEDRLAELWRLKRKYGGSAGSIQNALEHLATSEDRLRQIERSDERETELRTELATARAKYLDGAKKLHEARVRTARKFEKTIERELVEVAMENARFQVQITGPSSAELSQGTSQSLAFGPKGVDGVEFYFSANPGEDLKPLARVASGGEASRLMLVLKTVANASEFPRTIVFDEIDTGIGGRVSEAVGVKLQKLSQTNQVLCVTHQPQIARFARSHLFVEKAAVAKRTRVSVTKLDQRGRIEELARMLTGAEITDSARRHAKELLKTQ